MVEFSNVTAIYNVYLCACECMSVPLLSVGCITHIVVSGTAARVCVCVCVSLQCV